MYTNIISNLVVSVSLLTNQIPLDLVQGTNGIIREEVLQRTTYRFQKLGNWFSMAEDKPYIENFYYHKIPIMFLTNMFVTNAIQNVTNWSWPRTNYFLDITNYNLLQMIK